jgi:hypothetical protein
MKKLVLVLLFITAIALFFAQTPFTATYTFGSGGNVQSFVYNGTSYSAFTMSNIDKVGVTSSSSSSNFRATTWPTASSPDTNKYIGFTITAASGYKFTVSTITFGIGRSSTGTRDTEWRGSADSYAALINNYTTLNSSLTNNSGVLNNPDSNSNWTGNVLTLGSSYANITTSVGFRMYMYNAEASGGTAGLAGPITITGTYDTTGGTPTISLDPSSLSGFYYTEGSGPSQEQSFTVSGTNLTANISVDAPTNYQISLGSGGSFSPQDPITLTQSGGSVAETTIYVRLASGLNAGGYNNETITASSSGATDQTVTCNGVVLKSEPTDHVTSFTAGTATASTIPLTWTDAAKVTPDGYLIKGSDVGYGSIVDPSDGSAESDGPLVHNVAQGNQSYTFSGLSPLTTYYFKIYPYTNSGANIDYKVSGTIPQATATTLGSSSLSPGDIAIIAFQVDTPDQFAFITFVNISAGTEIHFTDNGWTDTGTLNNTEGTVTWTAPASKDLAMGEIVVVTSGSPWTADNGSVSTSGSPAFATAGDQLIAYQGTSASPTLLYALSTTPWVESGEITSNTTYLPTGLVDGTTAIDFPTEVDNQYYNVTPITGTPAQVLASIGNPSNWERSDSYLTIPEWEVGTLPIELSSFTATIDAHNYVQLTWVTQSETNVMGFYVYRSAMNDLSTAELISPMVAATNTSQQQFYTYTDTELFVDGLYYYWLQNSDMDGSSNYHGPVHVSYSANGTNNGSPEIPTLTELKAIYPNPFNPIAYIPYSIASRSNVDIAIYNSRGQLVRSFALGTKETGSYRLEWNGMDNNGKACTTGVYYVRMTAGNDSFIRKAVLMK